MTLASFVSVALPQDVFRVRQNTFRHRTWSQVSRSRYQPSVPRSTGARDMLWVASMETPPMSQASVLRLEAFFARLRWSSWCFTAFDPFRAVPQGVGNGHGISDELLFTTSGAADLSFCSDLSLTLGSDRALVRDAAVRGATSIVVTGLNTDLEGQAVVKEGDCFSIGQSGEMNLHMAMADAICDASGECRIEFLAPLWKRALPNDTVQFVKPTGRFMLVDDETGEIVRDAALLGTTSVSMIEVPYQEPQA